MKLALSVRGYGDAMVRGFPGGLFCHRDLACGKRGHCGLGAGIQQVAIESGKKLRTDVEVVERSIGAGWEYAVAEENHKHVVVGVNPEHGAGEAKVSEGGRCGFVACGGILGILVIRFVEAETSATSGTFEGGEQLHGLLAEETLAAVGAAVEPHLAEFG